MEQKNLAIDFVIAWVDGNDPQWIQEKNANLNLPENRAYAEYGLIDAGTTRFRDWDNLRYWFRAVEQYAPWVRKIHFITNGQIPAWMNTEAPKLHVVKHSDYLLPEYLPTFNSHPIELNMHRIEDLAEHFVYFNDDFFLNAPVKPEEFFVNGLPCCALEESPLSCSSGELWEYVRLNDTAFLNRHFDRLESRRTHPDWWFNLKNPVGLIKNLLFSTIRRNKFFGLEANHLPQPYLKSVIREVWELEPELLHETSRHQFRCMLDVSQCILKHYQMLSGRFHPSNIRRKSYVFSGQWDPNEAAKAITDRKYHMICINDSVAADFETARDIVNTAFAKTLPNKSSFEL